MIGGTLVADVVNPATCLLPIEREDSWRAIAVHPCCQARSHVACLQWHLSAWHAIIAHNSVTTLAALKCTDKLCPRCRVPISAALQQTVASFYKMQLKNLSRIHSYIQQ